MGLISFSQKGDFSKSRKFFNRLLNMEYLNVLERYGQMGVAALSAATPVDTGKTASSWEYKIQHTANSTTIMWDNTNLASNGSKVAILLQ